MLSDTFEVLRLESENSKSVWNIECKSSICLDVATRWNSTYLMLKTAAQFEKAFERYQEHEPNFVSDLGEFGVPSNVDWYCTNKMADLLSHFYELTLRISGSLYVTSHSFFNEICDLCCILNEWKGSNDSEIRKLGESMKSKFDKYWGDPNKMNKIIFWANIFYPHDKLEYMGYSLGEMYGAEIGGRLFESVKDELSQLFTEYKNKYLSENDALIDNNLSSSSCGGSGPSSSIVTGSEITSKPRVVLKTRYKKQKMASGSCENKKSELNVYLEEAIVEESDNFDVLKWWKLNSERFPILSKMARDILAVPISTVASESAFSTGGRVLSVFRSFLTPKIVETLICAQDWLRTSNMDNSIEELLDDLETFEKELPAVRTGLSIS